MGISPLSLPPLIDRMTTESLAATGRHTPERRLLDDVLHQGRPRNQIPQAKRAWSSISLPLSPSTKRKFLKDEESLPACATQTAADPMRPCKRSTLPQIFCSNMSLPKTYDPIFSKYAGGMPIAFLRALSEKESGMNPSSADGAAWGLLQVIPVVLQGYNDRYRTGYSRNDLLNADVNTKIAADLLLRIAKAYSKHPSQNMQPNFGNPEFVKLLLAGWNSGYSEGGGVGKVASYLEARGIPVTHDNVFAYADQAGATEYLQNSAKQNWQRGVANLYYAQPDAFVYTSSSGNMIWKAAVAIAAGLVAAKYLFR